VRVRVIFISLCNYKKRKEKKKERYEAVNIGVESVGS
jgi:hypothetical protein